MIDSNAADEPVRLARARSAPTTSCRWMLHCRAWVSPPSRAYRGDPSPPAADSAHGRRYRRCRTVHGPAQCRGRARPPGAAPVRPGAARPQAPGAVRAHRSVARLGRGLPDRGGGGGQRRAAHAEQPARQQVQPDHHSGQRPHRCGKPAYGAGTAPNRNGRKGDAVKKYTETIESTKRRAFIHACQRYPILCSRRCCSSRSANSAKFCPLVKRETSRARRGFPMLPLLGGVDAE